MKHTLVLPFLLATVLVTVNCDTYGQQYPWTKDGRNPVLSGVSGAWNNHVFSPCVLFNSDSARYEMWFNTTPGSQGYNNMHPWQVGFAVSKDSINWTMHPSAVLSPDPGTWDNITIDVPEVIRENGQYKMWYTSWKDYSSPGYLGYATSPDGIHWTKFSGNPVFGPGTAAWEIGGPYGCTVMPVQGGYKMWYGGYDAAYAVLRIGYATSADGITWKRDTVNNPVLNPGASGQWDDKSLFGPNVLRIGNAYYMWYVGATTSGTSEATGVATSPDGINWTRYAANPLLVPSSGAWDTKWADVGSVVQSGNTLHMWYDGMDANLVRIGHATTQLTTGIAEGGPELPQTFMLEQNYPNPFNPSTTIRYGLPQKSAVRLTVFNTLGQQVAQLVNGDMEAGFHEVRFDASGLSSGVYFYRLRTGGVVETKQFLLLR
jgi:predicted GH43/DUF377 family glycosyl hydrolase